MKSDPINPRTRQAIFCTLIAFAIVACSPPADSDHSEPPLRSSKTITTISPERLVIDESALVEVLQMSDTLARVERVAAILGATSPDKLESVKAAFEAAALDRGDVEYALFVDWWARFDPKAAYGYTQYALRAEHPRTELAAARAWARLDPIGALESGFFLESNPVSDMFRFEMLDALVVGWFESGHPQLEDFLASLGQAGDITRGMRTYARMRVLRDGARDTLEWTRQPTGFPEVHHRLLIAGALTLIARQDPELASEWLPIAEADGVDIRTFLPRIAGSWAHHDPNGALDWLSTFPDTSERQRAVRRVGTRWSASDPEGLAEWLTSHGGVAWTDPLRLMFIRSVAINDNYETDWELAMQRAEEMLNAQLRVTQRIWNLQRWLMADPDSAEAWIESHDDELTESTIRQARTISMGERTRVEKALGRSTATPDEDS